MFNYSKVRKVTSLDRAHPDDAGVDFYVPDDFEPVCLKEIR